MNKDLIPAVSLRDSSIGRDGAVESNNPVALGFVVAHQLTGGVPAEHDTGCRDVVHHQVWTPVYADSGSGRLFISPCLSFLHADM